MFRFLLVVLVGGAIVGFIVKIAMKRRMSRTLGRNVADHELNSLNTWMQVHDEEERRNRRL